MRTTLDIPQDLLKEAQEELGFKSKTDVIIFSLKELLRKRKVEQLLNFQGAFKAPVKKKRKT